MFIKSSFSSVLILTALLATTNGFAMDLKEDDSGHTLTSQPKEKENDDQEASTLVTSSDLASKLELMNRIPCDVWKKFFKVWSENGIDPRIVEISFKIWHKAMGHNIPKNGADKAGIPYSSKNSFKEDCMRSYLKTKVLMGTLFFDKVLNLMDLRDGLKLSDFKEGTYEFRNQVITFDENRFNEKGGKYVKLITFICPLYLAKHLYPYGNWPRKDNEPTTQFALVWKRSNDSAHACHVVNLATDFKNGSSPNLWDYYKKAVGFIKEYNEWGSNLMWVRLDF